MPIRAVIDISVMVSVAFAKEGVAKRLRDLIADNAFVMVTSRAILRALYEVLHYPHIVKQFHAAEDYINEFTGMVIGHAETTEGLYNIDGIPKTPKMTCLSPVKGPPIRGGVKNKK